MMIAHHAIQREWVQFMVKVLESKLFKHQLGKNNQFRSKRKKSKKNLLKQWKKRLKKNQFSKSSKSTLNNQNSSRKRRIRSSNSNLKLRLLVKNLFSQLRKSKNKLSRKRR